jgi:predicted phage terminase large subunit-like protein
VSSIHTRIQKLEGAIVALSDISVSESQGWRSLPAGETFTPLVDVCLAEYVERTKHIKLDGWQIDICEKLDESFKLGGARAAIHAFPQSGKSIIISQCQPAYLFGQDPAHRFRLATYNVLHSARFSRVVQNILRSQEHREIFKDKASWIPDRCSYVEWSTFGRLSVNDGQASFTALGLKSGFVGTGADTLVMDDPYKSAEEAYSQVIRDSTWRFWEDTARPRVSGRSNVFIMFHRYHQDDQGGRALASGEFDLWRYAAQADGAYTDDETGLSFGDPMKRKEGEYLTLRAPFTEEYYEKQKKNKKVWNSQFQGRPTDEAGEMFNVNMLREVEESELPPMIHTVRAWDNAATEGGGAFSVGLKMGIDAPGNVYIQDIKRKQVNTAGRKAMQKETAEEDGLLTPIHAPQDPGSAGKDIAFEFEQELSKYQVATELVSGSKESRAYPFSQAVNEGRAFMVKADWNKDFKNELKHFPLGTYKDQVDAGSDAYNHLMKLYYRGLVIKGFDPFLNLVSWPVFASRFGQRIPKHWDVRVACRIEADASKPSGFAIVARAAENAKLGERVFLVAGAKYRTPDPSQVINGLKSAFRKHCLGDMPSVFISPKSAEVLSLSRVKLEVNLQEFKGAADEGIAETNWYFEKTSTPHPFVESDLSPRIFFLVAEGQIDEPQDEAGLVSARQEAVSWAYNDRGEPQSYGGVVMDCARMILKRFRLQSTPKTRKEKAQEKMLPGTRLADIPQIKDEESRSMAITSNRIWTEEFMAIEEEKEKQGRARVTFRR